MYGLFNDSFPPVLDGVTLAVQNYVGHLVQAGRQVTVVTPWNPRAPEHEGFELKRYFSLPIYNRHPYRYGYPWFDPFIWRQMRRIPFRLVHAHCPFSSGRLAAYAARYHHIPLVTTFHSKYRTDLERSLPPFMVEYQMRRMLRFYNDAFEVWIPQAAVEDTLREYGYQGPVTVVENGNDMGAGILDLPAYKSMARRSLGMEPGLMSLLFVGQHILEKGVEVIIRALSLLPPGMPWRMDFIGNGYAEGAMKKLTRELGMTDSQVRFHGVMHDRELLRRHYAAADLFLFPSFYDNAPLVVREAAALGTPTLLLRGSTAAEKVTDQRNGFLTTRTPQAYAQAIAALHRDPERMARAGEGARMTLSRPWSDVMREVMERYDDITARYDREGRGR